MKNNILLFAFLLMLFQPLLGAIIQDEENKNDATSIINNGNGAIISSLQQAETCSTKGCQHNGLCVPTGNTFECRCTSPYTGKFCENDYCNPNPCLNGGKCEIKGLFGFSCSCPEGVEGEKCETKNNCENGRFTKDSAGNEICNCNPEYALISKNKCKACNCGQSANCKFERTFLGDKTCICPDGFIDLAGTCVPKPEIGCNKACKHGTCVKILGLEGCSCIEGYEGDLCEKEKGSSCNKACKHGTCVKLLGIEGCSCSEGYEGDLCDHEKGKSKKVPVGLIVGLCVGIPLVAIAAFGIYRYIKKAQYV